MCAGLPSTCTSLFDRVTSTGHITDPGQVRMAGPSWLRCTTRWRSILRLIAPPGWTPVQPSGGEDQRLARFLPTTCQPQRRMPCGVWSLTRIPTRCLRLVHGDYRSANILVAGPGIAAVIDFEEARFDHRIDELARSAVMLGTRFRDWGPASPEVRTAFLDGYQSERRMTAAEATWWDALVLWYSLVLTPAGEDPTGWGQVALDQLEGTQLGRGRGLGIVAADATTPVV